MLGREFERHKGKAAIGFAIVTALMVLLAFQWPKVYVSTAVLYADEQNIIRPLLEGKAAVAGLGADRFTQAVERLSSSELLSRVVKESGLVEDPNDVTAVERWVKEIVANMEVSEVSKNHMMIAYYSDDPAEAYKIAGALSSMFIQDSAQSKQERSLDAYKFIDKQVAQYKAQLQEAEERLKRFNAEHTDGTEGTVAQQITALRKNIDELTLELQMARVRRDELRGQVSSEGRRLSQSFRAEAYRQRLAEAQGQLDTLRLSYQETYPDIVALKEQIEDIKRAILLAESDAGVVEPESVSANPVYQQLRTSLSGAEVEVRTLELRLASARNALTEAEAKTIQVGEIHAQLAELTRDYDVTRGLYEGMLARKEQARMSMALDEEGQGVNYRLVTAPIMPRLPDGLRFIHIFAAAPLLGLLAPLGMLIAYIILDPRVRFIEKLQESLPPQIPVLAQIPYTVSPQRRRMRRIEWAQIGIFVLVVVAGYVAVGVASIARTV